MWQCPICDKVFFIANPHDADDTRAILHLLIHIAFDMDKEDEGG